MTGKPASFLQTHATALIDLHGGLRPAARALRIDAAYLCRLSRGDKISPGPAVLKRLGLVRVITYTRRVID